MAGERLLLVEDDESTRIGLAEYFRRAGFECQAVSSYREAILALRAAPPAMLITDVRLDEYNGLHLVLQRPPNVQALVITAFSDPVLQAEAERSGARFVEKPVDPAELVQLVRRLLQSREFGSGGSSN
jgi:DNA-binding NtrC family response regulator